MTDTDGATTAGDTDEATTAGDTDEATTAGDIDGATSAFHRTDAVLVRQPLSPGPGADGAVETVLEACRPDDPAGTEWLLSGDDVVTVSLFLAEDDPALLWYVEVTDGPWRAAGEEVVARSPLFDAGLGELLEGDAVRAGEDDDAWVDARRLVVHAATPGRPGRPDDPDVVMVRVGVEPGLPAALARGVTRIVTALQGTALIRPVERSSTQVLLDERMWTETLWLEREAGRYVVRWYMEADDLAYVQDTYEDHGSRVARWSEGLLDRLFVQPVRTLSDPTTASGWTLLAHAASPGRG
jgi:hypothetical protein